MVLERDCFAAEIACIWSKVRVIEYTLRSRPNHKAYQAIDELAEVALEIERLMKYWEDRIGSCRTKE